MLNGVLQLIKNKKKRGNENYNYFRLIVELSNELANKYQMQEIKLLFTKRELTIAFNRALKNQEDFEEIKDISLWDKIIDTLFN